MSWEFGYLYDVTMSYFSWDISFMVGVLPPPPFYLSISRYFPCYLGEGIILMFHLSFYHAMPLFMSSSIEPSENTLKRTNRSSDVLPLLLLFKTQLLAKMVCHRVYFCPILIFAHQCQFKICPSSLLPKTRGTSTQRPCGRQGSAQWRNPSKHHFFTYKLAIFFALNTLLFLPTFLTWPVASCHLPYRRIWMFYLRVGDFSSLRGDVGYVLEGS